MNESRYPLFSFGAEVEVFFDSRGGLKDRKFEIKG